VTNDLFIFLCVGKDNTGHEWHFYVISGKNRVLFKIFSRRTKRQIKKKLYWWAVWANSCITVWVVLLDG